MPAKKKRTKRLRTDVKLRVIVSSEAPVRIEFGMYTGTRGRKTTRGGGDGETNKISRYVRAVDILRPRLVLPRGLWRIFRLKKTAKRQNYTVQYEPVFALTRRRASYPASGVRLPQARRRIFCSRLLSPSDTFRDRAQ